MLLRAVLLDPADDLCRLAFADCLEEGGEDARAEFIRAQVALGDVRWGCGLGSGSFFCGSSGCRLCPLLRRQQSAWRNVPTNRLGESLVPNPFAFTLPAWPDHSPPVAHVCRGFAQSLQAPLQTLLDHGGAVAARHPVERVVVTDREPFRSRHNLHCWSDTDPSDPFEHDSFSSVGEDLFRLLPQGKLYKTGNDDTAWMDYDTPELAKSALAHAVLNLMRLEAGLPELPWKGES